MVFISYSHDSDDFCDKILDFSNYLRSQGIDSIIDQYEESPAEGWPRWMLSQIKTAEYVLVVCTEEYESKSSLSNHNDVGLGVKWESKIIIDELYDTGCVTSKFIPIVFKTKDVKSIISPLKGQTFYNVEFKERKRRLVNRLLGIKENKKVPLGTIPPLETKIAKTDSRVLVHGVIDIDIWDKAKWKGVGYSFDFEKEPILMLHHEDINASIKIFSDWINRFGREDKNDEIYISIIEENNTDSYSVHIGADTEAVHKRLIRNGINFNGPFAQFDRWHRMTDVQKEYLTSFKNEVDRHKSYLFLPAKIVNGNTIPLWDLSIKKKKINFRNEDDLREKTSDYDYPALNLKNIL